MRFKLKKINIVCFRGYFGQSLPTPQSLDVDILAQHFSTYGYETAICDLEVLANEGIEADSYYLFGSHQNPDIKAYYNDVVSCLFAESNRCIPAMQYILAHENKGVQSLLNERFKLGMPKQIYKLVHASDPFTYNNRVHKLISGSGSSGVFLPATEQEYFSKIRAGIKENISLIELIFNLKLWIKHLISKITEQKYLAFSSYYRKFLRIVIQDKLDSVGYDYKVLVFGEKCFVLKRNVRPNDFRSSGSGLFEFVEVPPSLLDFALAFKKKLVVPYVSLDIMDIAGKSGEYACIEFQCVHFGPYTKYNAPFGYEWNDGWTKIANTKSMEEIMAQATVMHINNENHENAHV